MWRGYCCTWLHWHTHTRARAHGRTPLDYWSARRTNTQQSQKTDIHASGGIRTRNLRMRAAADPRFRPRGYRNRLLGPTIIQSGSFHQRPTLYSHLLIADTTNACVFHLVYSLTTSKFCMKFLHPSCVLTHIIIRTNSRAELLKRIFLQNNKYNWKQIILRFLNNFSSNYLLFQ